jgi:glycerol-3-phosphate dehydrogenase (NAD(P)+)
VTGPCVAGELIRRRETCVVFAGRDPVELARWAQGSATGYYHVWTSTDLGGCAACAALKNAFAIAMGFATGLRSRIGAGSEAPSEPEGVAAHNYEAAVFAEAIREMRQLVRLVGGSPETVDWLPGVGDLLVTTYARSQHLGRLLGSGLTVAEAMVEMTGVTLEGLAMIESFGTAMPVLEASGALRAGQLPLMRHLVSVISGGQVAVPFGRFFEPPSYA